MAEYITKSQVRDIMAKHYPSANLREETAMHHITEDIKALPAADVVEVRHGYWDSDGHTVACSNCHTLNLHQRAWEYCPYCGAKMEV